MDRTLLRLELRAAATREDALIVGVESARLRAELRREMWEKYPDLRDVLEEGDRAEERAEAARVDALRANTRWRAQLLANMDSDAVIVTKGRTVGMRTKVADVVRLVPK